MIYIFFLEYHKTVKSLKIFHAVYNRFMDMHIKHKVKSFM